MYHTPFILGYRRSDGNIALNIGLAVMLGSIVSATSVQFLALYYTLPNVSRYGSLLGLNKMIVRYPSFISNVSVWQGVVLSISVFTTVFLVPSLAPELQLQMDYLQISIGIAYLMCYIPFLVLVTTTIEFIFRSSIRAFGGSSNQGSALDLSTKSSREVSQREIKALKKALAAISAYRAQSTIATLVVIGLYLTLIVTRFQYQHIFFNVALVITYMSTMLIALTFVFTVSHVL